MIEGVPRKGLKNPRSTHATKKSPVCARINARTRRPCCKRSSRGIWVMPTKSDAGRAKESASLLKPAACSMGGTKAHYDYIGAFSETDFTEDLKRMDIPTLVMHGDDDQIVPVANAALKSSKILKRATLKIYPGLPHGMCTTNPEQINPDLL